MRLTTILGARVRALRAPIVLDIVLHCSQYFPYEDHLPSSWDLMLRLRRMKTNVEVKPINLVAPMLIVYIN